MPSPGATIVFRWTEDYQDTNGPDGEIISAKVHVPWTRENLTLFPSYMKGANGKLNNKIVRDPLPYRHPHKTWLYCTQCDLVGGIGYVSEETGDGSIRFASPSTHDSAKAVFSCQWSYLGYDVETDAFKDGLTGNGKELCRFVSRKTKTSVEAVPISGTAWKFSADNHPINEPTTILVSMAELEYTWHWVPFPYRESVWDDLLGKVNSAAFDGRGRGSTGTSYPSYPAGTVYFASYERSDPFTDPAGNICTHITFTFLYRRQGWNKFYRPGSGFVAVEAANGSGQKPFAEADLMTIFD